MKEQPKQSTPKIRPETGALNRTEPSPPVQAQRQHGTSSQTPINHAPPAPKIPTGVTAEPPQETSSPKQRVESGEYQRALDESGARYRKHPRDQALRTEYVTSIEGMKSAADRECEEEEFSSAGRMYDLLLKRYGQFRDLAHMLSFNRDYLNKKLAVCKKSLSVRGFQEYRKGNISQAILLWQGLLSLDPNNEDIKKAVITAKEQQKNLQKNR